MTIRLRGLYAITLESGGNSHPLFRQVEKALLGGAGVIQYRDKSADTGRHLHEAKGLARLCGQHGVPLIINDDVELALASGAAGVHLGVDDADLKAARERLGDQAIIGVSCYNRLERAIEAEAAGADYVAFGRFFPSRSKPKAVQADLDLLREARRRLRLPLVAIGGITPDNGAPLLEAGADMLAVIEGVFGQPDIVAACRRFTTLFKPEDTSA